ncbi:MAG: hypothetical protein FWG31_05430 [Oscillospiraceae bacterium]|nr:hypothetical protein [Oscillospiraceae bacterium]
MLSSDAKILLGLIYDEYCNMEPNSAGYMGDGDSIHEKFVPKWKRQYVHGLCLELGVGNYYLSVFRADGNNAYSVNISPANVEHIKSFLGK